MSALIDQQGETDTANSDYSGVAAVDSFADREARFERDALAHLDRLYTAALRLTGDRADAEELVQETYVRAYRLFAHRGRDTDTAAFLFRVLAGIWRDTADPARAARDASPLDRTGAGGWRGAHVTALERLPEDAVADALAALPPELRMTLYFADVEGYSYQQVAEITDTSRGTVMSRLCQARRRLRTLLTTRT